MGVSGFLGNTPSRANEATCSGIGRWQRYLRNNIRCINLEYHALEKEFRPKVVLEREFLHKIMCKSIKKAVAKTKGLQGILLSLGVEELGLKFDFLNGWIQIKKIPKPPEPSDEIIKPIQTEHHQQNT